MDDPRAWYLINALPRQLSTFMHSAQIGFDEDTVVAAVLAGRIYVNGLVATSSNEVVLPCDIVTLDGTRCKILIRANSTIYAYYKPTDMTCDKHGLGGVISAFCHVGPRPLHHVGRLDKDTTGLLLFTDDGDLTRLLTRPGNVSKEYVVGWEANADSKGMTDETLAALQDSNPSRLTSKQGDHCFASFESCSVPVKVEEFPVYNGHSKRAHFESSVLISSGQNHVVKRLFQQLGGISVRWLHRRAIGPLTLECLGIDHHPMSWIRLSETAVAELWQVCGGVSSLLQMKRTELWQRLNARPEDARFLLEELKKREALMAAAYEENREVLEWIRQCALKAVHTGGALENGADAI